MPRSTSPTLESLLPAAETQSTVEIHLRDGTVKRYCTGEEPLVLGGNTYLTDLLRVGELKETLGQATNRVPVKVSNVRNNGELGKTIAGVSRKMELAEVIIKRLYRSLANPAVFEWKHFFTGKAANAVAGQEVIGESENGQVIRSFVAFDVISDTTAAGTCIATTTLSPNNGWKFPEVPEQSPPGSGGNDGGGIGGGTCFIGTTRFGFFDTSSIDFAGLYERREEFIGRAVARSFDENNRIVAGEITAVFRHLVYEYLEVTFDDGTVSGVTAEHPYFTDAGEYVGIGKLKAGDRVFDDSDESRLVKIVSIEKIKIPAGIRVYNAEIARFHNYSADSKRVHNSKDRDV